MGKRYVVILAAGQGTRMKSKTYKVLHKLAGKTMVEHVVEQVEQITPSEIVTVVGHGAEEVERTIGNRSQFVFQAEQLGTGHAVLTAGELLAEKTGTTLVICGDTPLITAATLQELFAVHEAQQAKATILSAEAVDPFGYGRVIRDQADQVAKIVEQKDANETEQQVTEINTGTYCFDNQALFAALQQVGNHNAQHEYYLPDVIGILQAAGEVVTAYKMPNFAESIGINDRVALAEATRLMRERINQRHLVNGVTLIDPSQTYIDADVQIGADTIIEAGVQLKGQTVIGSDCYIGAGSEIRASHLGDQVTVTASMIEESVVANQVDIGPYAHLRPKAQLAEGVHIGNFVEVKNAEVGPKTKVGHLTYIGDATLGADINVGCGTIFVNYDGKNKFQTKVGDGVFIGCNANLVAPVSIGSGAFIAAGSTITKDVPADSLAIGRSRQENKRDYAKKLPARNDK